MCLENGTVNNFANVEINMLKSVQMNSHWKLEWNNFGNEIKWLEEEAQESFSQIICWSIWVTTTVMEVKLHNFRGRGSTTVVAVKNQVQ